MSHYVAIIEDAGENRAVGIWFPDLAGCFAAGDTVDEALENAPEAISIYAEALAKDGRRLPHPRRLEVLKDDPDFIAETEGHLVALVEARAPQADAAE